VLAAVAPAGGQIPTLWALEIRGDLTWLSKSGRWRRSGGTAGMRHISIARPPFSECLQLYECSDCITASRPGTAKCSG